MKPELKGRKILNMHLLSTDPSKRKTNPTKRWIKEQRWLLVAIWRQRIYITSSRNIRYTGLTEPADRNSASISIETIFKFMQGRDLLYISLNLFSLFVKQLHRLKKNNKQTAVTNNLLDQTKQKFFKTSRRTRWSHVDLLNAKNKNPKGLWPSDTQHLPSIMESTRV